MAAENTRMVLITDDDALWAFAAFGVKMHRVYNREELAGAWREAVGGAYSLIFITETLAAENSELIVENESPFPIIVLLPGARGSRGTAAEYIRRAVVRALGADITKTG
ncbi:MAG: V-type ATP synthase subunit F [bacterium]|jgi:vacuolar-type H+-ATPase subunit F/Vma7|nr:V-type ATP synthase subunit F [bacterium]MDD3805139.1 V-type ATP synthase subunit F [bacterium]MDD4152249.1 V-type ATP synthase subunit F [bacterium]MDD4559020.1 V-type ATP synthase subunit F [bacterium]